MKDEEIKKNENSDDEKNEDVEINDDANNKHNEKDNHHENKQIGNNEKIENSPKIENNEKVKNTKNEKEDKFGAIKFIGNVFYYLLLVFILVLLLIVVVQRFSNNTVSIGGIKIYNIVSESMIPKYQIGDILIAKEVDPSTLQVGDDIVYKGEKDDFAGKIVTHQIIRIQKSVDGYKITTKGIANDLEDPMITDKQVQGKIIYKFVVLSAISKVVNNLYSMYFVIFIPIAIVIFFNVIKIINGFKHSDDEDDEEENSKKNKNKNK